MKNRIKSQTKSSFCILEKNFCKSRGEFKNQSSKIYPTQNGAEAKAIFLVGNSNSGKSTVFNRLTKRRVHTGNWNGVTVSAETSAILHKGERFLITDLPGIYSLNSVTLDEINANKSIKSNPDAIFVNVVDCNALSKSLNLTLELIASGLRVVVLLNFTQTAKRRGLELDLSVLSKSLNVPVCSLNPFDTRFTCDLLNFITQNPPQKHPKKQMTALARKREIDRILSQIVIKPATKPYAYTRADNVFTSRVFGVPIFLIFLLASFWLTFGVVGNTLKESAVFMWELCVKVIISLFSSLDFPQWLINFVGDGVLASVGGIIGFLPQICIMWLCLELLEQSGYISRIVWLLEPFFVRLGLSGKSAFSLLLGFGCTTLATPTTLAIKSRTAREKTACILPYMSCNAKLPVLLCVASVLFPQHTVLAVFLLYLLGVGVAIVSLGFWQKIRPTPTQNEIFEFTPLVLPNFASLLHKTLLTATRFLRKIWGIVLVFGVIVWFASNFNFMLQPSEINESILSKLAQVLAPIFVPLGLNWGSVVALVVGIVAKEMVLSTIAVLNGTTNVIASLVDPNAVVHFDLFSGIAFLIFCTLYTPCISALSQLKAVLPRKIFIAQIITQFVLAYVISLIAVKVTKSLVLCGVWEVVLAVSLAVLCAILLYFVLKWCFCHKKCSRNCNFCNRF